MTFTSQKTHDLVKLVSLMPALMDLQAMQLALAELSAYAVEFRYPGESSTVGDAKEAIKICQQARNAIRRFTAPPLLILCHIIIVV